MKLTTIVANTKFLHISEQQFLLTFESVGLAWKTKTP
jgi:hypothetical protein